MNVKLVAILATAAVIAPQASWAHHSFAMFDNAKTLTLTGTVKNYQFANPHTFIDVLVPNAAGVSEQWAVEGASPNQLSKQGWKKTLLKPGDKISVKIHPLKNGERGGSLMNLTLDDGRVLANGPGGPPPGGAPGG